MSYGTRMALSFALTSLMTVLILVCVVSVVWGNVFSEYTRTNVTEIAQLTSQKLASIYEQNGSWNLSDLVALSDSTIASEDLGLQVMDADGTILYDDTWPAAPGCRRAQASEGGGSSASEKSNEEWSSRAHSFPVRGAHRRRGRGDRAGCYPKTARPSVRCASGYWAAMCCSPKPMPPSAIARSTPWSWPRSWRSPRRCSSACSCRVPLVKPIRRITSTAKQIRDGDLSARTELRGDDEIDQLGETFDEMATSLEKDLKHERRLTSDVAHELRTPLMAMLATVEAMQDGVYPTDAEHLETVASETRRWHALCSRCSTLSRMENRTAPLNLEAGSTSSRSRATSSLRRSSCSNRATLRLRFTDETGGHGAVIEVDADMITQAVINLLSNAMRYTPEGGWVVASVKLDRKKRAHLGLRIRASASPRKTCRASSAVSGALTPAVRVKRAVWAWALRSPSRSSSAITGSSPWSRNLERVRLLRFICRASTHPKRHLLQ